MLKKEGLLYMINVHNKQYDMSLFSVTAQAWKEATDIETDVSRP